MYRKNNIAEIHSTVCQKYRFVALRKKSTIAHSQWMFDLIPFSRMKTSLLRREALGEEEKFISAMDKRGRLLLLLLTGIVDGNLLFRSMTFSLERAFSPSSRKLIPF